VDTRVPCRSAKTRLGRGRHRAQGSSSNGHDRVAPTLRGNPGGRETQREEGRGGQKNQRHELCTWPDHDAHVVRSAAGAAIRTGTRVPHGRRQAQLVYLHGGGQSAGHTPPTSAHTHVPHTRVPHAHCAPCMRRTLSTEHHNSKWRAASPPPRNMLGERCALENDVRSSSRSSSLWRSAWPVSG